MSRRQSLIDRVSALPEELLADVEESMNEIERWRDRVFRLTDEERAAVRNGMEAAHRGEFVSDEELAAYLQRHRG